LEDPSSVMEEEAVAARPADVTSMFAASHASDSLDKNKFASVAPTPVLREPPEGSSTR